MVVPASRVGLARGALEVAGEDVPQHRVLAAGVVALVAPEGPGVVLLGPQVDALEGVDALVAEQRVLQLGHAVFRPEEQAEAVLGIVAHAAVAPANPQARVDLEPWRPIRIDQLHGDRPLPVAPSCMALT